MRKEKYCCDEAMKRQYMDYYKMQAGHGLPGFQGTRFQRGRGLGGMFKGLLRLATPLFKKGAVELGKTALRTGLSAPEGNKRPPRPKKRSVPVQLSDEQHLTRDQRRIFSSYQQYNF